MSATAASPCTDSTSPNKYEKNIFHSAYQYCYFKHLFTKNIYLVRHFDRWYFKRTKKEHDHRYREK